MKILESENCRVIRLYDEYQDVLEKISLCEDELDLDKVREENRRIINDEYNKQLDQAIEDKLFEFEFKPRRM